MKDHDPSFEVTPALLLRAYEAGVFPMADSADADEIFWVEPRERGIIPLDGFHVSRSLRRRLMRGGFRVTVDRAFTAVVDACADRSETWINGRIRALYAALFEMGHAHSVEVWQDNRLVGGLYGVRRGAAFFGESMFSRATDGSKIALAHLVARLSTGGFRLLDTQFITPHLASLGAISVPRAVYLRMLDEAVTRRADFYRLAEDAPPETVVQRITQRS
jgi:leucyl/phenylalanyl-tRNA--protein transferase